jgi:Zn-dependent peptidase ImmA (M78 family)/predicted secreted protein
MRERLPIFEVIEDARIWLFFRPLHNLYGVYMREGDVAGIVVNSQHPLSLQRFTAAHEYGHHVLGHAASADDEERIYRRGGQTLHEVAAQSFAGEFLMPVQLVNYTLKTMGITARRPNLRPRQVYQLALELGVSYTAAVTQLVAHGKLSVEAGQRLRKVSPLEIKTGLAGIRPEHSWADVWLLDESQDGREIVARLRDEIHLLLRETPSTGYVWEPVDVAPEILQLVDDSFESADGDSDMVGADGLRHLFFRVVGPGAGRIKLERRRAWERSGQSVGAFEATLDAAAPLTGDDPEGVTSDQQQGVIDDYRALAA